MLTESEVEERIRKHLEQHGFIVLERTKIHGVDIKAAKDGKNYYIEVQGNTKRDGSTFTTSQKYTHLLRAIGQICLRMNDDPKGVFSLALPQDKYYKDIIEILKVPLKKLGVSTYFVDLNGRVVEQ